MAACYWCHWGWPKPIRDIYDDCVEKLDLGGGLGALHWGPAHIVWEDENFDEAAWCLDNFDNYTIGYTDSQLQIVRESLERLLNVPDEFKSPPDGFDEDKHDPADFPPPEHWDCERR